MPTTMSTRGADRPSRSANHDPASTVAAMASRPMAISTGPSCPSGMRSAWAGRPAVASGREEGPHAGDDALLVAVAQLGGARQRHAPLEQPVGDRPADDPRRREGWLRVEGTPERARPDAPADEVVEQLVTPSAVGL